MSLFSVGSDFGVGAGNRLLTHGYYETSTMGEGEVRLKLVGGKYYHYIKISGVEYKVAEITRADIMSMVQVVSSYSLANTSILAVTAIPEEQPPRPETPSKIIPMDSELEVPPVPDNLDDVMGDDLD